MKTPPRLQSLVEEGLIDEVLSRLMSGKEADVFIVRCGREVRCAKVYKEAHQRSFKKAVTYREGRKSRNSRRARAMDRGSRFGRDELERSWQTTEVDALNKLSAAGVRVPTPHACIDGVLLMELITDADGDPAPRLGEVSMSPEQAREDYVMMLSQIVEMLRQGLVHGDLSEFNVLVDEDGPVIIDLPQVVDAAANNNARAMFTRDVNNMTRYYGQFAPELLQMRYADEIWNLFEAGELDREIALSGQVAEEESVADVGSVLSEIRAVLEEEQDRRRRMQEADEDSP